MSRIDPRRILFLALALLLGFAAVMLHRVPVQRYVVDCARTTKLVCTLQQTRASSTQHWQVALGADATANVRLLPQRRGRPRVFLYLDSTTGSIFAAEFEGADAAGAAAVAAERLNRVLHAMTPGAARVEAAPPPLFRWSAWGALVVMGLLVILGYRNVPSSARAA